MVGNLKKVIMRTDFIDKKIIDIKIAALWKKKVSNASEAHFRADEITRLERIKNSKISFKSK